MARIIGIDVPDKKRLEVALTYIYGIGRKLSNQIIAKLGLDPNMRAHQLTQDDVARINAVLQSDYVVRGRLKTSDSE
jgi:small subunit ribosomal protein S13